MKLSSILPNRVKRILRSVAFRGSFYRKVLARVEAVRALKERGLYKNDPGCLMTDIRRLAHITEKGLLHSSWEPGHGKTIATQLEEKLQQISALGVSDSDSPSLRWAEEIIDQYNKAQQSGVIAERKGFLDHNENLNSVESAIFMRRSVRDFLPYQIQKEELEKIVEVVNWSSTSCNRQPAFIYAARNPDKIKQIMRFFKGATNFSDNIAGFLVFCADLRGYSFPMETWLPPLDVGLGVQNCAIRTHDMGLSMTLLSWAQHTDLEESELRRILNMPDYYEIIVGAVIGRPAKEILAPGRKDLSETIGWVE